MGRTKINPMIRPVEPPLQLYHGSDKAYIKKNTLKPILHTGTLDQAKMRNYKYISQIVLKDRKYKIINQKDKGSWDNKKLVSNARKYDIICYLNRYEGIDVNHLEEAAKHDHACDKTFLKNVPSADYSWIILNTEIIEKIINLPS